MGGNENVLAFVTGTEKYIFWYDDEEGSVEEVLRQIDTFATDPELEFSWDSAEALSQRVRETQEQRRQQAAAQAANSRRIF